MDDNRMIVTERTVYAERMKEFRDLTNRRFRCVASRIKNMEERVDICMRIAVLGFVASIAALVVALVV